MKGKKIYKNRLVCFLDALGYSAKIEEDPSKVYAEYSTFIDKAQTKAFYGETHHQNKDKKTFEEYMIMSDSMLFISSDIQDEFSVNNFVGAIQYILELGLEHGFAFRGAIGFDADEIIFDSSRNMIISKEFNKLTKLEPNIDMPTCIICKNAENLILKSLYGKNFLEKKLTHHANSPLIEYDIPIKKTCEVVAGIFKKVQNHKEKMWCLNYTFFSSREVLDKIKSYLIAEKKIYFTEYLEYIESLPSSIQKLPINFFPKFFAKIMISNTGMKIAYLDFNMKKILLVENANYPVPISEHPENIVIEFNADEEKILYKFRAKYEGGVVDINTWDSPPK